MPARSRADGEVQRKLRRVSRSIRLRTRVHILCRIQCLGMTVLSPVGEEALHVVTPINDFILAIRILHAPHSRHRQ